VCVRVFVFDVCGCVCLTDVNGGRDETTRDRESRDRADIAQSVGIERAERAEGEQACAGRTEVGRGWVGEAKYVFGREAIRKAPCASGGAGGWVGGGERRRASQLAPTRRVNYEGEKKDVGLAHSHPAQQPPWSRPR